jgi:hypothetical protein
MYTDRGGSVLVRISLSHCRRSATGVQINVVLTPSLGGRVTSNAMLPSTTIQTKVAPLNGLSETHLVGE